MKNKKSKILFLTPYPQGTAPGQRFRFEQQYQELERQGHEVHCYSFLSTEAYKVLYKKGHLVRKIFGVIHGFAKRIFHLVKSARCDYVFVYRELSPIGPPIFEWALVRVLSKKLIYDFDDAIWVTNTSEENGLISALKNHSKVPKICSWSHKVSVGNEYLKSYASDYCDDVVVIPTTIDMGRQLGQIKHHRPNETPVIGWTGSHSTTPYLEAMNQVLGPIINAGEAKFRVICNKRPRLPFSFEYLEWNEKTEIEDLLDIDIGIMPLPDTEWAKGKCGFKALQYMSLGIPAVVSPVGVNSTIIEHFTNGFLCETDIEWADTLKMLINNQNMRTSVGQEGHRAVVESYSAGVVSEQYIQLFD